MLAGAVCSYMTQRFARWQTETARESGAALTSAWYWTGSSNAEEF